MIEKRDDPLLDIPRRGPRPMVLQLHIRGRSLHWDLRIVADEREDQGFLIGWTILAGRPGAVRDAIDSSPKAAAVLQGWDRADGNRFLKPALAPKRIRAFPKGRNPLAWLAVDGKADPGTVGATRNLPGFFHIIEGTRQTGMVAEYGVQEADFHEYFLVGGRRPFLFSGTILLRRIVGGGGTAEEEEAGRRAPAGESLWIAAFAKNPLPSILRPDAVEKKRMPPPGRSWLPRDLEQIIPAEFRYWTARDQERARAMRDALVEEQFLTDDNVRVIDGRYRRIETRKSIYVSGWESTAKRKQRRTERREGETIKECVSRKIPLLIREGMPSRQAIAVASRLCGAPKPKKPAKKSRTVKAIVIERMAARDRTTGHVIPDTWNFVGGVGPLSESERGALDPDTVARLDGHAYAVLGKTHNSNEEVQVGGVIEVEVAELLHDTRDPNGEVLTWVQPCMKSVLSDTAELDSFDSVTTQLRAEEIRKMADDHRVRLLKVDGAKEERTVTGIVLEPEVEDSQGDIYSEKEVRFAAHWYMENGGAVGLMHNRLLGQGAKLLQSFIAPVDFELDGQRVKKGTWIMVIRILDPRVWADVKAGRLTGLSIGGDAIRTADREKQEVGA